FVVRVELELTSSKPSASFGCYFLKIELTYLAQSNERKRPAAPHHVARPPRSGAKVRRRPEAGKELRTSPTHSRQNTIRLPSSRWDQILVNASTPS
ncbi:AAEL006914-PA, partial [Aedes aegypti]